MNVAAVPLIALEAVALDLEATGLDPIRDRIVEIGAVRLRGGTLKNDPPFRRLVQPGIRIPKAAVAIHGIDQESLLGAPKFAEVWTEAKQFLGSNVIIGHALSFDLALLQREVERTGLAWKEPTWLDTKILATLIEPDLTDRSLDELAVALGVEISLRHTAIGDAMAAADIFGALIPRLRQYGVQTVAEAVRASDQLVSASRSLGRAQDRVPDVELPTVSPDSYPFRGRISDVMSTPARWVKTGETLDVALKMMTKSKVSSLFISDKAQPTVPSKAGIVTERDVLRMLELRREQALKIALDKAMTKPVLSVPQDALAYVGIGRMKRHNIRHLAVTDDTGIIIGAVSARDLLRLRAEEAVELTDEIEAATDAIDLARARSRLIPAVTRLRRDGMSALELASLISQQIVEISRAAARIAESLLADTGANSLPPYAFAVLGSAARGESLLAMDQDNALIFAPGLPPAGEDWFESFSAKVNEILDSAGVAYCKGGVMAKNPSWRGSTHGWKERIGDWLARTTPDDLLAVDIFFDLKTVHGDPAIAEPLRLEAFDLARNNVSFAKLLLAAAGAPEPALTWSGAFRVQNGRLDLKKTALFNLVSTTRVLAICHNITDRSTFERLRNLRSVLPHAAEDIDALIDAQSVFLGLILDQQLKDAADGVPLSNRVEVRQLSAHDRKRLRSALAAINHLDRFAIDGIFA